MRRPTRLLLSALLCLLPPSLWAGDLEVHPSRVQLHEAGAAQRLLVTAIEDQWRRDVSGEAHVSSSDPAVVAVDERGRLTAVSDGAAEVTVAWNGRTAQVVAEVSGTAQEHPVSFQNDIQPILTARGCNAGACHGKARGQNGFKLSLLGFDSDFDHAALTRHARGRRIAPARPQESLLLRKAAAVTPHGGGRRIEAGGDDYQTLLRWITAGAPRSAPDEPQLVSIEVTPSQRRMRPGETQQLLVMARYSDQTVADVTSRTTYQSNASAIVSVDETGLVQAGSLPGEAALMARYMGLIAVTEVAIPLPGEAPAEQYDALPVNNFVDRLTWDKLQSLGITPSGGCDDAKFIRRVYIDIIGMLPTPDETLEFLADTREEKRSRLIDQLLERPEFADHWANKWTDLLRPNPYRVGIKATLNYDHWIRDSFRKNKPYDEFVRELVTAQGSTWRNGAATLFRDRRSPDELATLFSQLFLGIRLECAKCHHHPFERWSQEDFYSFAAYFARVDRKGRGLSPPISGSEEMILAGDRGEVSHPLTGETLAPRTLYELPGEEAEEAADADNTDAANAANADNANADNKDRRQQLARWMTSDNPYFAQVMANRVWADLMGRGLVEPVDDLRDTNPPTNGPLLRRLGEHFRDSGYDIKALIRVVCNSHVYQLSSLPNDRNVADTQNYSRHYRQRLRAEVLAQAVSDVTGVPFEYEAMPPGSRASQIWTHRVDSLFLDTFGRPDENQDPPCERSGESTVTQALHLMNAPQIHEMVVSDEGRAAQLAKSDRTPEELVRQVYLRTYCRPPDEEELRLAAALLAEPDADRRRTVEDLMWALMNTPEFVFKD